MTWGNAVNNALKYYDIPTVFQEWRQLLNASVTDWNKRIAPWRTINEDVTDLESP